MRWFVKVVPGMYGEYRGKLDDNQQRANDLWFDKVGQKLFTFKHSMDI